MPKPLTNITKKDEEIQYKNPLQDGTPYTAGLTRISANSRALFGDVSGTPISQSNLLASSSVYSTPIVRNFISGVDLTIRDAVIMTRNTHCIDLEAGSSQYLSIGDGSQTGLDVTEDITLEAQINLESQPGTNQERTIVAKFDGSSQRAYDLSIADNSGTKQIELKTSSNGSGSGQSQIQYDVTLSLDTWYHVAATLDTTLGIARIYLDGELVYTDVNAGTSIANTSSNFTIGALSAGNRLFDGRIDDVRVWNIKRTGSEIDKNKNIRIGAQTGLVGYWQLNNALTDSSGNGNTLTNNNGASFVTTTPIFSDSLIKADASTAALSDTFIGFCAETVLAGRNPNVFIGGVVPGFSGLSAGARYYLSDTAGGIQTTAGTVNRRVGLAVSETELLIVNIINAT